MNNFYRDTKKYLQLSLKQYGFRSAEFGEGLYHAQNNQISVIYTIDGMWSEIRISSGVRFSRVNSLLIKAARLAEWPTPIVDGFKLKLYCLFREEMGCYYSDTNAFDAAIKFGNRKDIMIATPEEIKACILSELERLTCLSDLCLAVSYVKERQYFEPFGQYMIPAAAMVINDRELWDWAVEYFRPIVAEKNRISLPQNRVDYDTLLSAMGHVR